MTRTPKQLVWDLSFSLSAVLARSGAHGLTRALMRSLGALTLRTRRGRPRAELEAVGREWQRMFPSKRMVPITGCDASTVYAQIHARCPLRGTGDTAACHRMMEYDRRMLEDIGGQLVVLRSQAEPGRSHCEVAIRLAGTSVDDLEHAHLRTMPRAGTPAPCREDAAGPAR